MKLIQVDPAEATKKIKSVGGFMTREFAERVLDKFIESGVKCCRLEDENYNYNQMTPVLWSTIKENEKFRDRVIVKHNYSKVYLIRK